MSKGLLNLKFLMVGIVLGIAWPCARPAQAGPIEFSLGFSYNKSKYEDGSYNWSRRWGSSLGYHFFEKSEVEFAIQDVLERNYVTGYEDTTFHDQIYSLNWVQSLLGSDQPFQPYAKLGIGQLNRDASGGYANGLSTPRLVDSVTGVLGLGARIYITRTFAIRTEATTYLTGGMLGSWKDNLAVTFGLSFLY